MGGKVLDTAAAARLWKETEGNPLFVAEAVRTGFGDSAARPARTPTDHPMITARLLQLPPDARRLVEVAATIGRGLRRAVPKGIRQYWKAGFVRERPDEVIAAHVEHGPRTPTVASTRTSTPSTARVDPEETAFGHRDARYAMVLGSFRPEPTDDEADIRWVRDYYAAVHPYSGTEGNYINFMAEDDMVRAPENYGRNYRRLQQVKATFDPENFFHLNQNIEPAS
ncbi:hypothetical protein PA7_15940 [Pseudonocardia asaccharolytica DSM 44247 = NBRC 16224]|uniref:Berberine/berberine-like domain-containing protein n=1 Tax=Pseudonocardia asaccharolytica DSM 44247 = NBRC 16224 TaxID=1123024 RepID=A0A511CZ50_9PSEU|nr:hypothetical protein PA7_15940 [Pseudonocardia asaccharolytica DSM 44247 = NBRC 16224]